MVFFFLEELFFFIMKGILDAEVYTPEYIVNRMISYADIQPCKRICDPACGTGNILVGIVKYMQEQKFTNHEIASFVYGYDIVEESVQTCRQRLADLLPDISRDIIGTHIKCCDTLKYITDRFSTIIMNPPYAKDLHKKFLIWAIRHADNVVSIQPCQQLYKHIDLNKLDAELQSVTLQYVKDIYIMNPNLIWNDHKFASPVGIFVTGDRTQASLYIHDEMTDDTYPVVAQWDMIKRHKQLGAFVEKLFQYLAQNPDTVIKHRELHKGAPYVVELAKIRGHISEKNKDIYSNDDFATMVTRSHLPRTAVSDPNKQHFWFDSEAEANHFIDYLKTDFARLCLYINKFGLHIDSNNMRFIPWFDFRQRWSDNKLFNLLGIENPNLADPTLLPKYYEEELK